MLRVLLVEDNPGDARLLQEYLADSTGEADALLSPLELYQAITLEAALAILAETPIDVILLDLHLPDSRGLETFFRVHERAPQVVVVILSGLADNQLAMAAIRHGAQDYLVKDRVDSDALRRSIRYALERERLQQELARIQQQQLQDQERRSLERLSSTGPDERDNAQRLLRDYTQLVNSYVRATRLQQPRPSLKVRALARRLASHRAHARDLVRLHLKMLENNGCWAKPVEERAFAHDARLVLVEVMGNLIDIYLDREAGLHHD